MTPRLDSSVLLGMSAYASMPTSRTPCDNRLIPQVVCEHLSHNHWLTFSAASDNYSKAPLSDCSRTPKSNGSDVVDLAPKPLVTISTGPLVCACQPHSLASTTSFAYFSFFPSKASSIASLTGFINSIN